MKSEGERKIEQEIEIERAEKIEVEKEQIRGGIGRRNRRIVREKI